MFDEQTLVERERECASDAEILALFRQWREARRQSWELEDDAESDAAFHRACDLEDRIFEMAASGEAGLAVKAYLVSYLTLQEEFPPEKADSLSGFRLDDYDENGTLGTRGRALKGFAQDAVRAAPDLAPVLAGIIDAPITLPPSREEEQKAALRERAEALAAKYPTSGLSEDDTGLVEAERRLREFQPKANALYHEFKAIMTADAWEEIIKPTVAAAEMELEDFLDEVEPETVIGCAVKLRRLADARTGLCEGPGRESAEQILAVVERQAELRAAINCELARRAG